MASMTRGSRILTPIYDAVARTSASIARTICVRSVSQPSADITADTSSEINPAMNEQLRKRVIGNSRKTGILGFKFSSFSSRPRQSWSDVLTGRDFAHLQKSGTGRNQGQTTVCGRRKSDKGDGGIKN